MHGLTPTWHCGIWLVQNWAPQGYNEANMNSVSGDPKTNFPFLSMKSNFSMVPKIGWGRMDRPPHQNDIVDDDS